jgi:hypothetical protein
MAEYPVQLIGMMIFSTTIVLAYLLKIIECAPIYDQAGNFIELNTSFRNFSNCLNYIYTTFLTVGYGEVVPKTNLGRFIGITTAVYGTIIVSILIIMIQDRYNLMEIESKVIG